MKSVVISTVAFAALALGFGSKFQKLEPGMGRAEVIEILGRPDGVQRFENTEALKYTNRMVTFASQTRADYVVVLLDGVVSEYGQGSLRDVPNRAPGMFVFVPL